MTTDNHSHYRLSPTPFIYYSPVIAALTIELRGSICVASNHCAFLLLVRHDFEEHAKYLDATDYFTFDTAGEIADMKAYRDIEEVRDAPYTGHLLPLNALSIAVAKID